MRFLPQIAAGLALAATASAQQVVLDFEDLVGFAPIPAGYGGVADWGSWAHSDAPDPNYPPASGNVRVFSVGLQQNVQFGQEVLFEGANVVSALPFAWELFHQGQLVHTSTTLSPNTGGPAVWLASGYTGPVDELRYQSAVNVHSVDDFTYTPMGDPGTNYCTANPNSTGASGSIAAAGSTFVVDNDLTLTASNLPVAQFGIFIVGDAQAQTPLAQGFLCVGGTIGRYQQPNQIQQSDTNGEFSLQIDLTGIPQGQIPVPTAIGDTWNFQAWYRDVGPSGPGANLTDGISITFN